MVPVTNMRYGYTRVGAQSVHVQCGNSVEVEKQKCTLGEIIEIHPKEYLLLSFEAQTYNLFV